MNIRIFNETLQKTNALLEDIEHELGWENKKEEAYSTLRSVLHAIRDRLTIEEAAEFASGLPILVRGIYYEGWKPSQVPIKMNVDEFLVTIAANTSNAVTTPAPELAQAVWFALSKYVSTGEQEDVLSIIPKNIAAVLEEGID